MMFKHWHFGQLDSQTPVLLVMIVSLIVVVALFTLYLLGYIPDWFGF